MSALPPISLVTEHAQVRALERYGMRLTEADLDAIKALCRLRTIVRKDSRGTVHMIVYRRVVMVPVVRGDVIVTFLPERELYSDRLKRRRQQAFVRMRGNIRGRPETAR